MRVKNPAAVALGRISTPAKRRAAKRNGELGGRPKGSKNRVRRNGLRTIERR